MTTPKVYAPQSDPAYLDPLLYGLLRLFLRVGWGKGAGNPAPSQACWLRIEIDGNLPNNQLGRNSNAICTVNAKFLNNII